ncbi:MAG: hypothetical protein EA398_08880 [Deltaproteobacteria bacterium]|nr:MAG: hypothetical protein EA398_08880 [Deltaproteobacteria bacterium]
MDGFYVAGFHNSIRRVSPEPPFRVTTVRGRSGESGSRDGQALDARFGIAFGIHAHPDGERIYYMDRGANNIREFNTILGRVRTVMGAPRPDDWTDGAFAEARFRTPAGLAQTANGRFVYVADESNHVIRRMDLAQRRIETLVGLPVTPGFADGVADDALLAHPYALALSADERQLYISFFNLFSVGNRAVRVLDTETLELTTLAGGPDRLVAFDAAGAPVEGTVIEGALADTHWGDTSGLALDDARGLLYVSDRSLNRIRVIDLEAGTVRTLAGGASPPMVQAVDENGDPEVDEDGDPVLVVADTYEVDGTGEAAILNRPMGLALRSDGSTLYVVEMSHHLVRRIDTQTGEVSTIAGEYGMPGAFDDVGLDAAFDSPTSLVLNEDESALLVVDRGNAAVRRVDLATAEVTTVAGELGIRGGLGFAIVPLSRSRFYFPVALTRSGRDVLLTDRNVVYRVEALAAAQEAE